MTSIPWARYVAERRRLVGRIDLSRYAWFTYPLVAFLFARVLISASAFIAEIAIPGIAGDGLYHMDPGNVWLDVWARWDSGFYIKIIEQGYWFTPGEQSSVAFFPLYPLVASLLAPVLGTLASGVVVSNLFLFGALIFLYRLTEFEFDSASASRAVLYIAIFPTAFFFSAVYTESTFLFLAVGAVYFARRRMWAWAGLFALLCASSRIVGLVVWGVIGLEWLLAHGLSWTTFRHPRNVTVALRSMWTDRPGLVALAIVPLGLLSYMIFLAIKFDDPIAFSTVQSAWGRELVGPIEPVMRDLRGLLAGDWLSGDVWWNVALDLAAFFGVLLLAIPIWRHLGASYALLCVVSILIPAASGTGSIARYVVVLFPVFMLLGHWGRRAWLDRGLTVSFAVLLGVLTTAFVNWVFVA